MTAAGLPREERRRRTETAILTAAQELFAEHGFERTTIRGVAAGAGVDPALVMQYYGCKEDLFAAAARWKDDEQRVLQAPLAAVPDAALADLFAHFEDGATRDSMIALMRNCLTHPSAAAIMRDRVMCERKDAVAAKITGADVELRAGLFAACMMGLAMARYLLEVPPVCSAPREDVERLFRPVLRALVDPGA
ncbi:MAG: TetR family transcriptional regulator [Actinomycetota bacterium]|nr:TetR family transcriptional regulator [Actinomycetota bacterium]